MFGAMPDVPNPEEVAMTEPNPTPTTDPGATPPTATPPAPTTEPAKTELDGLGEAGKKALAEERAARKELEKQLAALAPLQKQVEGLAPLAELAKVLGVKAEPGKTDVQTLTDQVAEMQRQMAASELRALRLEVAAEKSLTPAQAARLQGSTRDELAADADALKALFPAAPATTATGEPATTTTTTTPAPDPSQGARGGVNELQALLAEAQKNGNVRETIRLKSLIAEQPNK